MVSSAAVGKGEWWLYVKGMEEKWRKKSVEEWQSVGKEVPH
jgi:hypothetical protein